LPLYCRCEKCRTKQPSKYEYRKAVYAVRDLDLNRASEAVGRSIAELREMVSGLKAVFLAFCTQKPEEPKRA